ncbi:MAG: dihydrolipoyl dehydrogenase, partial [Proteobacteria bacterium]|nr:dihydrolipoyl dehydrogenase [Pseudomonadota bacterium]
VGSFPFSACGKAVASGDTKGFVKVIVDKASGKIVGTFIIGGTATDMIHEAALAMQKGATIEEIIETIHAHPTLSESFHEAAMIAAKRPLHFM